MSADVEVVFARGTVTPEQQKKVPLTQTQDEEHTVDGDLLMQFMILRSQNMKPARSFDSQTFFPEDTTLRYRYETKYRTATIMEEDALKKPTAAGEQQPVKSNLWYFRC